MRYRDTSEIIIRGVSLEERLRLHELWLNGQGGERLDVSGVYMTRANLTGANMARAILTDAYMTGADMTDAVMTGADMTDAVMDGANLTRAYMPRANLTRAILSRAILPYANMARAILTDAILTDANMTDANMTDAYMDGAIMAGTIGNMAEIRSAQFERWPVTWTQSADGVTTLQIGCQKHPLDMWEKADPRWIAAMDSNATAWWSAYGKVVLDMVKAAPATPHAGTSKSEAV